MTAFAVKLPGPCAAAAAEGDTVWCAAGNRLLSFKSSGTPRLDIPMSAAIVSLGVAGNTLAAVVKPGALVWVDPVTGKEIQQFSIGGEPLLVSGGGALWVIDVRFGRAWRVAEPGSLIGPLAMPGVDRAAADGQRLWWTSQHGTLLRSTGSAIDVGFAPENRGGLVVCAGSVWLSVPKGLIRINAWNAEQGLMVPTPAGPLPLLVCAGGILVGGSATHGLFIMDPSSDSDMRRLDADLGGDIHLLVATRTSVWAFRRRRPEAQVVQIRPG